MEKTFAGKKLLILGASSAEITLVQRAQTLGCYVIVTDYNKDWALSPAKYAADEAWDISWGELDTLEELCRTNGIDGITAGYSEFRVENLIKLCERLSLPCYITMEQLDITRDKIKFKTECMKYGVPVVNEYASPDQVTRFPVIVKPVDRGGSIGISIATDEASLEKAYAYAMDMSVTKEVIIEDFIHEGDKVDFYYAVEDGEIILLSTCDTINAAANGFDRVVQSAWLYPERQLDAAEQADQAMRAMIRGMGIRYGCILFSGFVLPNREFVFFECGFRMEGAHQYEYVSRRGIVHFLDEFIVHALTGSVEALQKTGPLNPNLKSVAINLYAKKGTIAKISDMKEIASMEDCSLTIVDGRVGEECDDDKAILTKVGMFAFCNESPKKLREDVEKAYSLFELIDENGQDMLYDRIDTSLIETWWR